MNFIDLSSANDDTRSEVADILKKPSKNLKFTFGDNKSKSNKDSIMQNGNSNSTNNNKQLDQSSNQSNQNNIQIQHHNQKSTSYQNSNSNSLQTNSLDQSSPISNISNSTNNSSRNVPHYNSYNNSTNSFNHSPDGDNHHLSNSNHYNHQNLNHQPHYNPYNMHNLHNSHHNQQQHHNRGAISNSQHLPTHHYSTQPHFITPNGQYNGQPDSHHHHFNHQYKMPYYTPPFTNSSKPFYPTNAYNNVLTSIAPITTQNGLIITSNQPQLHTTSNDGLNHHLNNQHRANINLVVSTSDNTNLVHSSYHPINGYHHTANAAPPNPTYPPHMQPTAQYIPAGIPAPHPMFYIHPLPMTQFYSHYAPPPPQIATAQPTTILPNNALHQQLATPPVSPISPEQQESDEYLNGESNGLDNALCDVDTNLNGVENNLEQTENNNADEQLNVDKEDKPINCHEDNQIESTNETNISNISFLSPESLEDKDEVKNDEFKFIEDISDASFNVSSIGDKSESIPEDKIATTTITENNDSQALDLNTNELEELDNKMKDLASNEDSDLKQEETEKTEETEENKLNESKEFIESKTNEAEINETESTESTDQQANETSNQPKPAPRWADLFKPNQTNYSKPNKTMNDNMTATTSNLPLFSNEDFEPLGQNQIDSIVKLTSKLQQTIKSAPLEEDEIFPKLAKKLSNLNLKHSLPLLTPRGFTNQSNWCYINSILQALLYCPPFYNLMREIGETPGIFREKSATPIIDSFAKFFTNFMPNEQLMRKIKTTNGPFNYDELPKLEPYEPKCIYNVLGNINNQCLKGKQEDAEEFFNSVINRLNEEMLLLLNYDAKKIGQNKQQQKASKNNSNGVKSESGVNNVESETSINLNAITGQSNEDDKSLHSDKDHKWKEVKAKQHKIAPLNNGKTTPISNIFGGSMLLTRTAGKDVHQNRQPFFTLQLNINNDKIRTVEDALRNLVSNETIHGYTCPKTNKTIEASSQTLLDQLPLILVLHIKLNNEDNSKIMKKVNFQIDLEIPKECLTVHDRSKYSKTYKLLAVVHHDGRETLNGHYLTDIYHIGTNLWLRCDDNKIDSISVKELTHPNNLKVPYLLFYRRCDTLRGSNKSQSS